MAVCVSETVQDFARFKNFITEVKHLFLQTTVDLLKYVEAETPTRVSVTFLLRICFTKSSITLLTSHSISDKTLLFFLESGKEAPHNKQTGIQALMT